MPINNLASILTFLTSLFLGFFIIYKDHKRLSNITFGTFTLCVAVWVIVNFLTDIAKTPGEATFWARMTLVTPALMPFLLLLFSKVFPKQEAPISKGLWFLLLLPALIILVLSPTPLNIEKVTFTDSGQELVVGPLYTPFFIYFALYLIGTFINLFRKFKRGTGLEKLQIQYLVLGLVAASIFALLLNVILPIFGFSTLVSLGPFAALFLVGSVSYAIIKHRLLDIEIIIRRSVVYSALLATLTVFYSIIVFGLNRIFLPTGAAAFPRPTDLVAIMLVAFTVDPLKRLIEKTTDKVFFKARYNAEETISSLSEEISSIINLDELLLAIKNSLAETVKMSKFAVYLKVNGNFNRIGIKDGFDKSLETTVESKYFLNEILEKIPQLLIVDELKQRIEEGSENFNKNLIETCESLRKSGVAIVVPLISKDKVTGAIFLGEKLSGDLYSNEDLKLLEILGHQAAIAIENARLYEEQKQFAGKLQVEVKKATTDLVKANDRLKDLDKAKDEFVSVVSHELRTPMTAVKSYVWLVLNGKAGPLNPKTQEYLSKVYQSSERLITMINDVLDVSHIETGRLNIDLQPVSPIKAAQEVVDTLVAKANEQKIQLIIKKDDTIPLISADIQKLSEVLTNLIGNALKFTKAGGSITVAFQKSGNMIETAVTDTGVGMSKDDLAKLFSKFGRLESSYATMASTGGSGLGLYITKSYLELMHGKIWVNSTVGKGTTFTFALPISQNQKPVEEATTLIPQGIIKSR